MSFTLHSCVVIFIFLCTKLSVAQFSFIHITDLHVSDDTSYVNSCDKDGMIYQCYIKELQALEPKPAFIVASGDISNIGNTGPDGSYEVVTKYLFPSTNLNPEPGSYFIDSAQTIPIYFTPGNHEYYTTLIPPLSESMMYYQNYLAPDSDYVVNTNDAVLVFMRSGYDDDRPVWEDPNIFNPEGSGFSNEQCDWLRNVLSNNINKRKIIVMHHPPSNAAGTNFDGTPFTETIWDVADGSILRNRKKFLNICDSNHVDVVLSGHIHQNVVSARAGNVVDENWEDSTRYVQTAAAFHGAYRVITVDSAFVNVSSPKLSCTGNFISETKTVTYLSVYPNPAVDKISVEVEGKAFIEISDVRGQVLRKVYITEDSNAINVGDLPAGVYTLWVITDKGIAVSRFVKQ